MPRDTVDVASRGVVRALEVWMDGVRRLAWAVLAASLVLTVLVGAYTARHLGINTDTSDMLSEKLPFRQTYEEYRAEFPYFTNDMAIVIDADTADKAEDAATVLERRLRETPELFRSVFYPANELFFRRNGLLYLDEENLVALSDRLAEAQPLLSTLSRDPTLRGLFEVLGLAVDHVEEDGIGVGLVDAFDAVSEVVEARSEGRPRTLSWRDLMSGKKSDVEARRRIILVQPRVTRKTLGFAADAMDAVRRFAREAGLDEAHGVRVRLTGSAALKTEELRSVSRGAALAGIISFLLVGGLLFIGLRSVRLGLAVLLTLVTGLVWTAGFAAAAVGTLNLISVAFAVLFIGLGVDFGIHFSLRYKEAVAGGIDHGQALRAAATGVGGALALSAAAAALAFFSFLPTAYVGVSELGLISGTGMFIAFFANLTLLPAWLTVMPFRPSGRFVHRPLFTITAERFVRHHARWISTGAVVLGVGAVALLPRAEFDYNPLTLKDPGTESVRTVRDLMRSSSTPLYSISVLAPDLNAAAKLADRLGRLDFVDRTVTLLDFVPRNQDEKLAIIDETSQFLLPILHTGARPAPIDEAARRAALEDFRAKLDRRLKSGGAGALEPAMRRLARALDDYVAANTGSAKGLAELEAALVGSLPRRLDDLRMALEAEPVTLADIPEDVRRRYVAADGRARVEVYPVEDLFDNAALRRFVEPVRKIAPNATDNPVLLLEAGDAVVSAFEEASLIALVLIVTLLFFVVRRVWDVLLVLAPLVFAACFTVATAVLLGLPFNFANIIVLPLLLGLGVANGIHIVTRARREHTATLLRTSTPRAILFSALTTIGSFGSLTLSSHRGTASMGELLTLALAFTLVCSLVVLPALMELRGFKPPARGA